MSDIINIPEGGETIKNAMNRRKCFYCTHGIGIGGLIKCAISKHIVKSSHTCADFDDGRPEVVGDTHTNKEHRT